MDQTITIKFLKEKYIYNCSRNSDLFKFIIKFYR